MFFFWALNNHTKKKDIGKIINKKFDTPVHDAMVRVVEKPNRAPKITGFQYGSFFRPILVITIENIRIAKKKAVIPIDSWSENPAIVLYRYAGVNARKDEAKIDIHLFLVRQ